MGFIPQFVPPRPQILVSDVADIKCATNWRSEMKSWPRSHDPQRLKQKSFFNISNTKVHLTSRHLEQTIEHELLLNSMWFHILMQ